MKIIIGGSMEFADKMLVLGDELKRRGHEPFYSGFIDRYAGQTPEVIKERKLEDKNHHDASKEFWKRMEGMDALLVLNDDRRGIKNYIGGNTLLDIGIAHYLGIKKFLLNPIPDVDLYKSELEAMAPIVLDGDLARII